MVDCWPEGGGEYSLIWVIQVGAAQRVWFFSRFGHKYGIRGILAILVINRVSVLAILALNRIWVLYSNLELGNVV